MKLHQCYMVKKNSLNAEKTAKKTFEEKSFGEGFAVNKYSKKEKFEKTIILLI